MKYLFLFPAYVFARLMIDGKPERAAAVFLALCARHDRWDDPAF
jgi:hypothetical protein